MKMRHHPSSPHATRRARHPTRLSFCLFRTKAGWSPSRPDPTMDIFFDLLHVFALRLIHAAYLTITAVQATARLISRSRVRRPPLHAAAHVGIVLDGGDSADVQRLAALISWLAAARVSFVTVCMAECDGSSYLTGSGSGKRLLSAMDGIGLRDVSVIGPGELPIAAHSSDNGDSRPAASRAAAAGSSAGSHHVSSCENDDGSGRLVVRILSLRSGRDDLVLAARRLCERVQAGKLAATQIDETAIESEVCANAGFPEPELILQCGPELHLGGLLPWHCRVTQFAHLGPLREVRAKHVDRALFEYAGVQQRHGR
jgi:hypothetical protein